MPRSAWTYYLLHAADAARAADAPALLRASYAAHLAWITTEAVHPDGRDGEQWWDENARNLPRVVVDLAGLSTVPALGLFPLAGPAAGLQDDPELRHAFTTIARTAHEIYLDWAPPHADQPLTPDHTAPPGPAPVPMLP